MPSQLRKYQENGINFLVNSDAALLADDMGLGKTVQVAVSLEILVRFFNVSKVLVIAPSVLKLNWEREIKKWAPSINVQRTRGNFKDRRIYYSLPIHVLIASYEEIRMDAIKLHSELNFDIIILDEAQTIKNTSSKTFLSCILIKRKKSWALTGTPIENKIDDLIAIFSFLKTGLINKSLTIPEIHSEIKDYFLRRRKEDVYDQLPQIIDQEVPLELYGKQLEAYNKIWNQRTRTIEFSSNKTVTTLFSIINNLKQICNFDPESQISAKLDFLNKVLKNRLQQKDKIIIFSQYVKTLEWLYTKMEGFNLEIFHGKLTMNKKEKVLNRFRHDNGPQILLMSLKAGGVGLNIPETTKVILFDRWWNPATENQAIHRAIRFGRTEPLHIIKLLIPNTIEEHISRILKEKIDLFEECINDAESVDLNIFDRNTLLNILQLDNSTNS